MDTLLALTVCLVLAASLAAAVPGQWPLPGHDNRMSARAEVGCQMVTAPREIWSYDMGTAPFDWAMTADVDDDGLPEILYGPSPLVCVKQDGTELWRLGGATVCAVCDVDGDGETEVITDVPHVIKGRTGRIVWTRQGPGSVGSYRVHVGKLIPERRGLQIACVSEQYEMNYAQVFSFAEGADQGKLEWEREFNKGPVYAHCTSSAGPYDADTMCVAAAVHGGLVVMDARDGSDLFRVYWSPHPGTEIVRNYGSLSIRDLDGDGQSEFAILNDLIAVQVGVFSPARGAAGVHADQNTPWPAPDVAYGELASYADGPILWRRYFHEWYPQNEYTLHVPQSPIADVDGDGRQEIVVSLHRDSWQLHVYDALTGDDKLIVSGLYVHSLTDLDGDGLPEIIAAREDSRTPREFTDLVIGSVTDGAWQQRFQVRSVRMDYDRHPRWLLGHAGRNADQRQPLLAGASLVLTEDTDSDGLADRLLLVSGQPGADLTSTAVPLPPASDLRPLAATSDWLVGATRDARMVRLSLDGRELANWTAGKAHVAGAVAADVDGDGRVELVVNRADRTVRALAGPFVAGQAPRELWSVPGWGFPAPTFNGPAAQCADVDGDGRYETLMGCLGARGGLGIRLVDATGQTRWQADIPGAVETPLYTALTRATFGDFNGDGTLDVYVSARMAMTGNDACHSFAFDGRDGALLWHNDASDPVIWHHTVGPTGAATVADVNADGADDVLFVTLDLCTALNGRDGTFIQTPVIANNIWDQQGKSTQWTAYGSLLPLDLNGDGSLEILQCAAWGQWGAWTLDQKLLWTWDPGRDEHSARHPGLADVDGDGKLEIGTVHNGGVFRCYDAATGALKWELDTPNLWTDTITADVDGDGLPEFLLAGNAVTAIEPVSENAGKLLWEVPLPNSRTPLIADVDGDGLGEIIVTCGDGKLRVLK
ncbi:MAG: VCBS repeat-containing protein [Armatimonadetes bacterium]|nr:VCBS repeat-containing protein [Armatimonadota bacterium]